jgi:hypothetical protein
MKKLALTATVLLIICLSSRVAWVEEQPAVAGQNVPARRGGPAFPSAVAEGAPALPPVYYVCNISNLNDYDIFANGGWDGNWYVGYNVCWIVRLKIPEGLNGNEYSRFFVGVKLGRAKTRKIENRPPWEKEAIPGSIYVAISSTSAWKASQRYFLTSTYDIPLEADFENALEGTGEARWFWVEVQPEQVSFDGPNFIAVWSPTDYFVSRDTSPILAGGWKPKDSEVNTWLNDEIQGAPPINASNSLKTPISVFEPAVALKLVPSDGKQELLVRIDSVKEGKKNTAEKVIQSSIFGIDIEKAWMETRGEGNEDNYKKIGEYLYNSPYFFTLKPQYLPEGKVLLRVACRDVYGNVGTSEPVELSVQPVKK